MKEEIGYLTDIFCKNGHDRKTLEKIINSFEKKTLGTNNNNDDDDDHNNNNNNKKKNNNNNNNTNKKQTVTILRLPKIGPNIKKRNKKVWI